MYVYFLCLNILIFMTVVCSYHHVPKYIPDFNFLNISIKFKKKTYASVVDYSLLFLILIEICQAAFICSVFN